ncbi:MAG: hypothetical protein ACLFUZ_00105 [Candidatus Micrarchaeia archaeon]
MHTLISYAEFVFCTVIICTAFIWNTGSSVQNIAAATIDTIWGFGSATDNSTNTIPNACSLDVAGATPTGTGNFTGVDGFETCAVGDGDDAAKSDVAFCVNITQGGSLFNGQTGDYELLTATDDVAGTFETYHFWLELN